MKPKDFVPVCAIGASAGGVVALRRLFELLPTNLGLAYVVIVHLSPDHPSSLSDILGNVTAMPVQQVSGRNELKPDCVYVIAPASELVIEGDQIAARPFSEPRGQRAPIDMFFRSVANGRGDGLAVILSGAGSDGAVGVRDVKEKGGIIFVQEPADAEYPMMPRSALASGMADFVGPISRLAERIAEVSRSKESIRSLSDGSTGHLLQRIAGFLHSRTGHDFSGYKRATILRRIGRRMQVLRSDSLSNYVEYLVTNPEEAQELFSDLLISVTSFFRDPGAYTALAEEVIPQLFENPAEDGIRVWVAGCATGEEAYSLAILLLEEAERRKQRTPIQVFSTDLDEGALGTAREGRYPSSIEADVSEERLARFFAREGLHYRVRKEVRDIVLFATHSVLKDPPFLRLDLISCRNLLIYLDRDLQREVCAMYAYGLKPNRFLFLGSAETVDASPELFAPVNRDARIFRARPQAARRLPVVSRFSQEHIPSTVEPVRRRRDVEEQALGSLHVQALEKAAPPSVLVDRTHAIMHLSANAGRFLIHPPGAPSSDVVDQARPELKLDLRTALRRAIDRGESTLTAPIATAFNGDRHRVTMHIAPVHEKPGLPPTQALVLFLDAGPVSEPSEPDPDDVTADEVRRLRDELNQAETRLIASHSENETAIQDLRVANEELQSVNEEYRSTAEELETSKEELQSMNEELQTVNAELKAKLESIGAAHSDLENLVSATDIGTLFLDQKLRIRMFTPRVADLFNVADADIGRTITDFTHRLNYDNIAPDSDRVLHNLTPIEREVESRDGRSLILRIRPYRTIDDHISGVVVTFIDVTERRDALRALRQSEGRFRALVSATSEVVYRMTPDWQRIETLHGPAGVVAGLNRNNGSWLDNFILADEREAVRARIDKAIGSVGAFELEHRVPRSDGSTGWMLSRIVPILDDAGRIVEWFGASTDVSVRRQSSEDLRQAKDSLALATGASKLGWGTWDFGTNQAVWDARGREIIGLRDDETSIDAWMERVHPEDRVAIDTEVRDCLSEGRPFQLEYRVNHRDGKTRIVHATGMFLREDGGKPTFTGLVRDVTDMRRWEEHQEMLIRELNHRVKNMLAVVQSIASQSRRGNTDGYGFFEAFASRIDALANAHSILTRTSWSGAEIHEVVDGILSALAGQSRTKVDVSGPSVVLPPNAAITFSLALHELGTNAIKHGAWSLPDGQVSIRWALRDDNVHFEWSESGGPRVQPNENGGFGRRLLEKGVPWELGGSARIDFRSGGLSYKAEFPAPGAGGPPK